MAHDLRATASSGRIIDQRVAGVRKVGQPPVSRLAQIATAAGPVAVLLAVSGGAGLGSDLVWGAVITVVFLAAIQGSYAVTEKELYTLGAPLGAAQGAAIGFVVVSALDLWAQGLTLGVAGLLLCSIAIFALSTAHRWRLRQRTRRILILGGGTTARDLIQEIHLVPGPFVPVGIVDDSQTEGCLGVPVLGRLDDLPRVISEQRPDLVIMGVERNRPAIFRHLLEHASLGFRVVELAQFYEHAFGRVPVRDITRAWFMSVLHLYQQPYSRVANRAFDITVSGVAILLVLPLALVLPLLIRTTRGPVILRQTRLGANGNVFTMYKFRTMREDAESGVAMWAVDGDPRTTKVGRLMRRVRLDEIPQLWNVLKGDMSIVGPRPERPEFLAQLQEDVPFWDRRNLIKPGITGWAQIRRGYTADTDGSLEKLSFDLWYLRHRNVVVDIAICVQTIAFLLRGDSSSQPRGERASVRRVYSAGSLDLGGRLRALLRVARPEPVNSPPALVLVEDRVPEPTAEPELLPAARAALSANVSDT